MIILNTGSRFENEKNELERVKMDLAKQYSLELQNYKMHKVTIHIGALQSSFCRFLPPLSPPPIVLVNRAH